MRDLYFFPMVIAIAGIMVAGSVWIGMDTPQCGPLGGADGPADYSAATLSGQNLCRVEGREGYTLDLADDILSIRGDAEANFGGVDRTPVFKLGPDLETAYAGRKLRISFEVKPTLQAGALQVEAMYSAGKAGNSGWQRFELSPDWQVFSFDYDVPDRLLENTVAFDYFSIRPVVPEKTRGIMIRKIEFRRSGF